jgi:hypothetical protein
MSSWRGFSILLSAGFVLLTPRPAGAVRQFPRSIQQQLALSYEPPCSLCHLKDNIGSGTVQTPFALSMRGRGLTTDRSSVTLALDVVRSDRVDSDGDGTPDVDELIAGTDPNTAAPAPFAGRRDPSYGCGGGGGAQGALGVWPTALVGAAVMLRRRGARRTRRSEPFKR